MAEYKPDIALICYCFSDLCLGQVRLIFTLPKKHGTFPEPLVYIHWFKPLHTSVPDLGMYNVLFAPRNHHPHALIIPTSHIICTCHLVPHFGHSTNQTWVSDSILDHAPSFYLNLHLWHYDFYQLCYLPNLQHLYSCSQREVLQDQLVRFTTVAAIWLWFNDTKE